jgi:DNA-binding protein HU-beta
LKKSLETEGESVYKEGCFSSTPFRLIFEGVSGGGAVKKNELIDRVTREARIRRSEAVRAVKAVVGSIRATISEGGKISLSGLGTFKVKSRKARPGRNPKTGETIQIPIGRKISFKPSLALKKLIKTPSSNNNSNANAA